jgi:hypothetical protein
MVRKATKISQLYLADLAGSERVDGAKVTEEFRGWRGDGERDGERMARGENDK